MTGGKGGMDGTVAGHFFIVNSPSLCVKEVQREESEGVYKKESVRVTSSKMFLYHAILSHAACFPSLSPHFT